MLVLFRKRLCVVASLMTFVTAVSFFVAGWMLGNSSGFDTSDENSQIKLVLQQELARQQKRVDEAITESNVNLDALAIELGGLQAKIMRIEALGGRLTQLADLDGGEFDFSEQPASGGPYNPSLQEPAELPDFIQTLHKVANQLDNRERQLAVLSEYIIDKDIHNEVHPAGWPIEGGWISSQYGLRTDPFTGKKEHHKGIDFAHKRGTKVTSVGAGVVTWSGRRYGYGNLVEIDHGNGYKTRYAHNSECLVKVGEFVKKNQQVSTMGSTGRSTGPHVHFEVLHNGKAVNPSQFLTASR